MYLSILLAILFVILSLPTTYIWSDRICKPFIRTTYDNCPGLPTTWTHVIHGIGFALVAFVILYLKDVDFQTPSSAPVSSPALPPKIEIEKKSFKEIPTEHEQPNE